MKKRKVGTKLFGVIMALMMVLSISLVAACAGTGDIPIESIAIHRGVSAAGEVITGQTVSLTHNRTIDVFAGLTPTNTTQTELRWSSSNEDLATVTPLAGTRARINGLASTGEAVIRVASVANDSVYAEFTVSLTPLLVNEVSLVYNLRDAIEHGLNFALGKSAPKIVTTAIEPDDATNTDLTITVKNADESAEEDSVISITQTTNAAGLVTSFTVTAEGVGEATITVASVDGNFSGDIAVEVRELEGMVAITEPGDFAFIHEFMGGSFYLANDIDFDGATIMPIGGNEAPASAAGFAFHGTFDGRGHTISNFTVGQAPSYRPLSIRSSHIAGWTAQEVSDFVQYLIGLSIVDRGSNEAAFNTNENSYLRRGIIFLAAVGEASPSDFTDITDADGRIIGVIHHLTNSGTTIFGGTSPDAVIKNLAVDFDNIPNSNMSGALVGHNRGLIENVLVTGTVRNDGGAAWQHGGTIVGRNHGTIRNVVSNVTAAGGGSTFAVTGEAAGHFVRHDGVRVTAATTAGLRANYNRNHIENIFVVASDGMAGTWRTGVFAGTNAAALVAGQNAINVNIFTAELAGSPDYSVLDPTIWDLTGDGLPSLRPQTTEIFAVERFDNIPFVYYIEGLDDMVALSSIASQGVDYQFTLSVAEGVSEDTPPTIDFSVYEGVEGTLTGEFDREVYFDTGSRVYRRYIFTIDGGDITDVVTLSAPEGLNIPAQRHEVTATAGTGVSVHRLVPVALGGMDYAFTVRVTGILPQTPAVTYSVAGGVSNATLTAVDSFPAQVTGVATDFIFNIEAAQVTGAISITAGLPVLENQLARPAATIAARQANGDWHVGRVGLGVAVAENAPTRLFSNSGEIVREDVAQVLIHVLDEDIEPIISFNLSMGGALGATTGDAWARLTQVNSDGTTMADPIVFENTAGWMHHSDGIIRMQGAGDMIGNPTADLPTGAERPAILRDWLFENGLAAEATQNLRIGSQFIATTESEMANSEIMPDTATFRLPPADPGTGPLFVPPSFLGVEANGNWQLNRGTPNLFVQESGAIVGDDIEQVLIHILDADEVILASFALTASGNLATSAAGAEDGTVTLTQVYEDGSEMDEGVVISNSSPWLYINNFWIITEQYMEGLEEILTADQLNQTLFIGVQLIATDSSERTSSAVVIGPQFISIDPNLDVRDENWVIIG